MKSRVGNISAPAIENLNGNISEKTNRNKNTVLSDFFARPDSVSCNA